MSLIRCSHVTYGLEISSATVVNKQTKKQNIYIYMYAKCVTSGISTWRSLVQKPKEHMLLTAIVCSPLPCVVLQILKIKMLIQNEYDLKVGLNGGVRTRWS